MKDAAECEGLAASILEDANLPYPTDAWKLIAKFGVEVEYGRPGCKPHPKWDTEIERWVVYLDPLDRPERQAAVALHELGHILLTAHGLTNDEDHAWLIAGAMLMPRDEVLRALRRGATVEQLVELHPHASHEMVGRRMVALVTPRVLWVHDVAPVWKRPYKVVSPGWRWKTAAPTPIERETMDVALAERGPVELVGGVRAWTAIDGPWTRVLCLSDPEVLLSQVA